jgi:hypothetical protein
VRRQVDGAGAWGRSGTAGSRGAPRVGAWPDGSPTGRDTSPQPGPHGDAREPRFDRRAHADDQGRDETRPQPRVRQLSAEPGLGHGGGLAGGLGPAASWRVAGRATTLSALEARPSPETVLWTLFRSPCSGGVVTRRGVGRGRGQGRRCRGRRSSCRTGLPVGRPACASGSRGRLGGCRSRDRGRCRAPLSTAHSK